MSLSDSSLSVSANQSFDCNVYFATGTENQFGGNAFGVSCDSSGCVSLSHTGFYVIGDFRFADFIRPSLNHKGTSSNPVLTDLFIRGRKLNIYIAFITQLYFEVSKDVRLSSTHFFYHEIPNKRELHQIALNLSSDIDFKYFLKIYKKCTGEPYSFLVNDTTLPSDEPLRFRNNILK